jgi:IS1 family transposase/predicted transcriptional regulator
MREKCPCCTSENTKKNGHTHYGKQNYMCKECGRQFVIDGQNWFITDAQKELVDKLLLERISLAGISRVLNISAPWLSAYIEAKYEELPDDLNADLTIPDQSEYLEDRFDEEINRLEKKKAKQSKKYTEITEITEDFLEEGYLQDFEFDLTKDLLFKELYLKERGVRIEFFGIQLDEMWSFVQKKLEKQWIWLALNPYNRQIVAFHVGGRGQKDAQIFYDSIPEIFKREAAFFTDYWQAYACVIPEEKHFPVGKDSGLTAYIERFNGTLRQRASRLVRKSLSFSKSLAKHIGAIKYFICNYNLQLKT